MGKVVADLTFASGAGPRLLPTLLSLNTEALNLDDVVTSQVGTLLMPFGGAFKGKLAEGLKQTVLVHTSKNAMPVDLIIATLSGEPSTRGFQPPGEEMPLAIRLTGKFNTAFPEGKPKPYAPPRADKKKGDEKKARGPRPNRSSSSRRRRIPWCWSPTWTCSPTARRWRSRKCSASASPCRATATSRSRRAWSSRSPATAR